MGWRPCYAQLGLCLWICPLNIQCLSNLLSWVLFCCYQCSLNLSCVACDQFVYLCYPNYVWLPIVIYTVALYNDSMCPWSTILSLHSYCRPYTRRNWFFVIIIALYLLILSSFQSLMVFIICIKLIGSLLIWDNRALICLLNRRVAGLGNPAPAGIDHICKWDLHHYCYQRIF